MNKMVENKVQDDDYFKYYDKQRIFSLVLNLAFVNNLPPSVERDVRLIRSTRLTHIGGNGGAEY